jgi:hypothetical protein
MKGISLDGEWGHVPPSGAGAVGNPPAGATVPSQAQAGGLSTAGVIAMPAARKTRPTWRAARQRSAQAILDRSWGKPSQAVEVDSRSHLGQVVLVEMDDDWEAEPALVE